jgi:hypothetical protein
MAPASGGYEAANLAAHIHGLVEFLKLEHPYIVGHDLGGLVNYAGTRILVQLRAARKPPPNTFRQMCATTRVRER